MPGWDDEIIFSKSDFCPTPFCVDVNYNYQLYLMIINLINKLI
ncbi:hypothetical protein [Staphylococcus arlettae]|uniref:Uncharacterized protein n=1 Tax=Staphylococcus arlettae TaxID=29378 RepID=A0A1W5QC89_9STAP|nr:hypothetical protein [Staphylococcus arlettae]APY23833.1 hypothetical protein [Staphylococcus arlettae]